MNLQIQHAVMVKKLFLIFLTYNFKREMEESLELILM